MVWKRPQTRVMADRIALPLAAGILAVGTLATGFIVTDTWKENRELNQSLSVTGSAKRRIQADLGILSGTLSTGGLSQQEANTALRTDMKKLLAEFENSGYPTAKVALSTVSISAIYELNAQGNPTGTVVSWTASQRVEVRDTNVQTIKKTALSISDVVDDGLSFNVNEPQYLFTKLPELRIEMQEAATRDAKLRAEKIVAATGQQLGTLREASMGVIQVTAADQTEFEDSGSLDTTAIDKDITAVVRLSFLIR